MGQAAPVSRKLSVWIFLLGFALFAVYSAWMIGPYLRSIVVRDAAVTSWSNMATSPIAGKVGELQVHVGDAIGADGVIT